MPVETKASGSPAQPPTPAPPPPPPVVSFEGLPREIVQVLESQRAELNAARARESESRIAASLALAINSHAGRLLDGVSDQVSALLRPSLRLLESGGESVVSGPALQSVESFVREALDSQAFSHFQRPRNTTGGTGSVGSQASPGGYGGAAPQPEPPPRNLGEAIIRQHQANLARRGSSPESRPSADMSKAAWLKGS